MYKHILDLDPENRQVIFALQEIEFREDHDKFIKGSFKGDLGQLKRNLSFFLIQGAIKAANSTKDKILQKSDDPETRDYIVTVYAVNGKQDLFAELFQGKNLDTKSFIDYFAHKSTENMSNDAKREYCYHMIQLNQQYLTQVPTDSVVRKLASINCSDFVWACLLTKRDMQLASWLKRSLNYDPSNQFARGNLLSIYLFNNDYEDAKPEFDDNKNKIFSENGRFRTYRDYYSFCVSELRKAGLKNVSISKISDLLTDHAENTAKVN